jgi:TP901 family phage tail tape measure protein
MSNKSTSWLVKLVDKITAPSRSISKAVASMTKGIDKSIESVNRLNNSQDRISSMIKGIGIAAAVTALTNQTLAFEHSMQKSNTILKSTPKEFEAVTDSVRGLSTQIPIAREQLSEGLYEVLSAGVPKENALTFLEDSAKAAVGGSAELPTLIRTTTTLVKAFNMEFDKAGQVQDKLQKSVDLGQMSMNELAEALPKASVSAAQLGVNVDELLGGFAAMAGVTGNANEVGTQLNAVMSALIKPTQEATEMAEQLGVAFDATSIRKAGGLAQYLDVLLPKIKAFANSSGMNQEEIIARLFGREEAIRGMLAVSGTLADSWKTNTTEIVNAAGSVSSAFEIMKTTSINQMELFKSSMFQMWDSIWSVIGPVVMSIIGWITSLFNWISAFTREHPGITQVALALGALIIGVWALYSSVLWATGAWAAFKTSMVANVILQVVGMIATLGAALFGLQAPFWAATSSTWALNAALWANPIVWIIALVAGLIAAIVYMIQHWDDVKAWFAGFYKWFKEHNPFDWVMEMIQSWLPGLKETWDSVWNGMKEAMKPIVIWIEKIKELWDKLWGTIKKAKDDLIEFLGLPQNLDFRGYGEVPGAPQQKIDEEAFNLIQMQRQQNELSRQNAPSVPSFGKSNSKQGVGLEASGGTKGAAIVNFKNTFDIKINGAKGDLKEMANELVAIIADQLSDAALTTR